MARNQENTSRADYSVRHREEELWSSKIGRPEVEAAAWAVKKFQKKLFDWMELKAVAHRNINMREVMQDRNTAITLSGRE